MKRRNVTKAIAISLPLAVGCASYSKGVVQSASNQKVKPKRLKEGDTIGLIAPGSSLSEAALEKCISNLEGVGFKVKTGKHWKNQYGYLAGTDKERLYDIHSMFADDTVDGIWCARGGYGCTRLLPYLDYNLIKRNPKILIGYSDITALLNAIYQQTGLVTFHGPVGSSEFNDYSLDGWKEVLMNPESSLDIEHSSTAEIVEIFSGKAQGTLVGGNLTLLAAMCGTPYQVDMKDKLVFIEDVGEKPYKIDRMLTQLLQASSLDQASGIILGTFNDCEPDEDDRSLSLIQCFEDRLGSMNIPISSGFSFGHISEQFTLPIGVEALFDASKGKLRFVESGVQ
ncbi:UNVERIFIED_CONTAM: hypothetical protein GTU68_006732 [Idotea baltica]|nr:hypothetical protein [Idotea baltica]